MAFVATTSPVLLQVMTVRALHRIPLNRVVWFVGVQFGLLRGLDVPTNPVVQSDLAKPREDF